jgi:hypothetical protein
MKAALTTPPEWVSGDPGLGWLAQMLAARYHRLLNALAASVWYAFDLEDGQRHASPIVSDMRVPLNAVTARTRQLGRSW